MSAIIFDFDGTIADSFDFVAEYMAHEADVWPLTDEIKQELRGRSMYAMARHLGYHRYKMPLLLMRGRRKMHRAARNLKPFADMPEVIRKLHAEGHELFLLSSNNTRTIRKFLRHYELHTYFLETYGGVGLFSKAPALRHLIRDHNLDLKDSYYIGDELRDVEAAQSIKLAVIAVLWGFARPDALRKLEPTAIAQKPADIIAIFETE